MIKRDGAPLSVGNSSSNPDGGTSLYEGLGVCCWGAWNDMELGPCAFHVSKTGNAQGPTTPELDTMSQEGRANLLMIQSQGRGGPDTLVGTARRYAADMLVGLQVEVSGKRKANADAIAEEEK